MPGMLGKNIEAMRVNPKAKAATAVREVFRAHPLKWSPETRKRSKRRRRILGVRLDEKVQILRKTGLRMKNYREASYDEVLNSMDMEGGQKVFVILVHPAPVSTL